MASITKQRCGKYTYLYESVSFWDAEKKRPDNNKTIIGKINLLTGEPVYTQEYLDKLASRGEPIVGMGLWDRSQEARVVLGDGYRNETETAKAVIGSVRDYGVVYFLRQLSEKIGLLKILRDVMPDLWQELFCLACYLIAADKPVMYCEEWVASNYGLDVGSMSSQRISDLLAAFGCEERNSFYRSWYNLIRAREYIALDITSVSSYSENIDTCEWGYNRDGESLPPVNICLLFGQESKQPVYQTVYNGSLRDVSKLKATTEEFCELTCATDIMFVMDKGFYSAENVNMLLKEDEWAQQNRFLILVPFTSKFAKNQVESERKDIDNINNVVFTSSSPIRGVYKYRIWHNGVKLHTHIFYNPEKAIKDKNELFGYVASLARQAETDPNNKKLASEYKKYLIVRRSKQKDSGVTVNMREDVVANELKTIGWFILISNDITDTQAAHDIYRMKDVVEKSFLRYKNNLGLDRLRVHSDNRMQNKIFVAFIALIIASAIYETMKRKDMFKSMTFDRLILTLAKLKSATYNGKTIMRPVTKEQMTIFKAFDIAPPNEYNPDQLPQKKRGRKPKLKD